MYSEFVRFLLSGITTVVLGVAAAFGLVWLVFSIIK